MEWTDNTFEKIYWRPLPCYKRPDKIDREQAVRYFLLHYAKGTGAVEDWRQTLDILLLGLRLKRHRQDPDIYILANEDKNKQLETNKELSLASRSTLVNITALREWQCGAADSPIALWYSWCLRELNAHRVGVLSIYFGSMALFFCRFVVQGAEEVVPTFVRKIDPFVRAHFALKVNAGKSTPAPSAQLCKIFRAVFERSDLYAKHIVCRLAWQRMNILADGRQLLDCQKSELIKLQNESCYIALQRHGSGLLYWFTKACQVLNLSGEECLEMLNVIGGLTATLEALKIALAKINKAPKSWQICRLLHQKTLFDLAPSNSRNFPALAIFVAIVCDADSVADKIWTSNQFQKMAKNRINIERGISIARSLRRLCLDSSEAVKAI